VFTSYEAQEHPGLDKFSPPTNPSPHDVWEQSKSCASPGDTTPNALTLREIRDNRVRVDTEEIPDASCDVARQVNRKHFLAHFRVRAILFG
jgi:hypothetical protein